MEFVTLEVFAVVGGLSVAALLFVSLGWILCRARWERAMNEMRSDFEPSEARLLERIDAREAQLREAEANCSRLDERLFDEREKSSKLQIELAELQTQLREERRAADEKIQLLRGLGDGVQDTFKALSAEALRSNNQTFLDLAQQSLLSFQEGAKGDLEKRATAIAELVRPLRESLEKVDTKIESLERMRLSTHASMTEQLRLLTEQHSTLRNETANLARALRSPNVRGRWGEIQLRRVVEMAGMVSHCDFVEQNQVESEQGRLRPDLIVRLPNNRTIVVDAKVPLQAYLEATEATDDAVRAAKLREHARQVRSHLQMLSQKTYWEQYQPGPDFVVMFLPGEPIYNAALEADPALIEFGVERKVLLSTPTNLIGLLRVIAFGWRQEALERNAEEISKLGAELYDRIRSFTESFVKVRGGLERAVDAYNSAVGSLERRVLVSARKFHELSAGNGAEIAPVEPVTTLARSVAIENIGVAESLLSELAISPVSPVFPTIAPDETAES